eukprot:7392704-Pyramimonas_sp.AAC.1
MEQILVGLLSTNRDFKQIATYPVLSAFGHDRVPDTSGANNFSASEKSFLNLARMLHAVDL